MFNIIQLSLTSRLVRAVLCGVAALVFMAGVNAQTSGDGQEFLDAAQRWLDKAVASSRSSGAAPLRMVVTVGALDNRLRLAPCARVEPYLPAGTRLWGRTRLGLRCVDGGGAKWNVFLPVTVQAYGRAWVVRGDIAPGAVLTQTDAMQAEVDWAEEASPIVADPAHWVGQVATRLLMTGQPLRQGMLKPAQVFQAGAQVRVVAQGTGFQVTSDGQAVSAGVVGQAARVRMESGRIMSGVVLDTHTVQISL